MDTTTKYLLAAGAILGLGYLYMRQAKASASSASPALAPSAPPASLPQAPPPPTANPIRPPMGHVGTRMAEKLDPTNQSSTLYAISFTVVDGAQPVRTISRFANVNLPTATLPYLFIPGDDDKISVLFPTSSQQAQVDQAYIIDQAVQNYLNLQPQALYL